MLTESENAWLKHRDIANPRGTYFYEYCKDYAECHSDMLWGIDECPTAPLSLHDAAEFEARVAAQLAAWETLPVPCMNDTYCDRSSLVCPYCRLKWARLTVEEEMDVDRK